MVDRYPKVILRKIDIARWESEAWKQAVQEYNADSIPLLAVYDGKGIFRGVPPVEVGAVDSMLRQALVESGN